MSTLFQKNVRKHCLHACRIFHVWLFVQSVKTGFSRRGGLKKHVKVGPLSSFNLFSIITILHKLKIHAKSILEYLIINNLSFPKTLKNANVHFHHLHQLAHQVLHIPDPGLVPSFQPEAGSPRLEGCQLQRKVEK